VVYGGGLTVGLRGGDGEREREGKIWGENGLGKRNGYRRRGGFSKSDFFLKYILKAKGPFQIGNDWAGDGPIITYTYFHSHTVTLLSFYCYVRQCV
jgi:hypothetical protein